MIEKLSLQIKHAFGSLHELIIIIILTPFSRKHRYKSGQIYSELKNPFFGPERIELNSLLNNENLEIKIAPLKSNLHNTTEFELLAISAIVKDKKCNMVFEIGTYDGRTTRAMAMNLFNEESKIFTINLPQHTAEVALTTSKVDIGLASKLISGERFINTGEELKITQLWGDSATFDFSPYNSQIDLVFIDGAHSESYVKNDTAKAIQMLDPKGGWLLWHDAPYFGVAKFLKTWIAQGNKPVYFINHTSLAIAFIQYGKVTQPPHINYSV